MDWLWIIFFVLVPEDLKVWRTDPGSIFDIDPVEDNIQSRSLRRMSGSSANVSSLVFTANQNNSNPFYYSVANLAFKYRCSPTH